ncbi:MAG: iduronate-2-sulfatase, partial [Verrucomicrobiota bacterium]
QGDTWDRDLFENHLMGYTLRNNRYRLVLWRDYRDPNAKPVYVELYDHKSDPTETTNIAAAKPELVQKLTKQLNKNLTN